MKYKAFHKLSYGIYIVSTVSKGVKAGYIGNTVFQVTSDPAKLAISCHKKNDTCARIIESEIFSVSVLKKECDTSLIGEFGFMSGTEIDKFRNIETITAETGAPVVVDSVVAWFDCRVVDTTDVGTHMLIIGEVVDSEVLSDDEVLTYDYYREKYKMLAPANAPTFISKDKLKNEAKAEAEAKEKAEIEAETEAKAKAKAKAKAEAEAEAKAKAEAKAETEAGNAVYSCSICGFQYDPEEGDPTVGIPPGTPFEDLPDDYRCPICNADKSYFNEV